MKKLIRLTPLEPYFLGGEHIFEMEKGNRQYFIRSLDTPSQTTLFGALRFMAIKNPQPLSEFKQRMKQYQANFESREWKREFHGFALNRPGVNFDKINSISPLYLARETEGELEFFIRTPLIHKSGPREMDTEPYAPMHFDLPARPVLTDNGLRCFPTDYSAKDGLTDSWLSLSCKTVYKHLFTSAVKVGINKQRTNPSANQQSTEEGFFKKEYKMLPAGYSFAFLADVDENFELHNFVVYLGQGRSPFQVKEDAVDGAMLQKLAIPAGLLPNGMVCAQSDLYYTGDVRELYALCKFVCVETRAHRLFQVNNLDRKDSRLIQLIRAGSVFWPDDPIAFVDKLRNRHAAVAGFNQLIGGQGQ